MHIPININTLVYAWKSAKSAASRKALKIASYLAPHASNEFIPKLLKLSPSTLIHDDDNDEVLAYTLYPSAWPVSFVSTHAFDFNPNHSGFTI